MIIAHRGLWNRQNRIDGIVKISSYAQAIEVDVVRDPNGVLVLGHDGGDDTLEDLCRVPKRLHIILDIHGDIAREVLEAIRGSHHEWELCSRDYRCVDELCRLGGYKVGLITAGLPHPAILRSVDFISQDHDFFNPHMLEIYRGHNLDVYIFNTQEDIVGVDGVIKNIFLDISN